MLQLDIKYHLDLDTVTIDDKRHYVCPDGSTKPSVTTVLGRYKDSQGTLDRWRKSVGEARADKIRDIAAEFGTKIHDQAENYIMKKNENIEMDFFQQSRWGELKQIIDQRFGRVYACETALYSDILGVAGRTDVIGEFDGVNSVIDFKNSNKPKKLEWIETYWLQTFCYGLMYWELTKCDKTLPKQLVIINTTPHDDVQVFVEPIGKWKARTLEIIRKFR